jgi:hypothetical protein
MHLGIPFLGCQQRATYPMPYSLVLHCLLQHDALTPEDLQGQKTLRRFLQS